MANYRKVTNSNSRMAFYLKLQDKSDHYLIALVQRVVVLLKHHEEILAKDGLIAPYKSGDLERTLRAVAHSRQELLELLEAVYSDPYLQLLQVQDMLSSTRIPPNIRRELPVTSSRESPISLFNGYTPKSNLSKYALGGRRRKTRRRRLSRRR